MDDADLARVRRWLDSGGTADVVDHGPPAVVSLCRCDGGEEQERLRTWDVRVVHLVEESQQEGA